MQAVARTQAVEFDERRTAIVDMAAQQYARNGFHGTSIAELAIACGISKSLLYHYFGSKEDILYEVMHRHIQALCEVTADIAHADPREHLADLTRAFVGLYRNASSEHKVLVNDLDKLPADRREAIISAERQLVARVEAVLARLNPALEADRASRRATAMLYFGMINWTHTWYRDGGPLGLDTIADLAIAIALDGMDRRT
jgi:AcrR family transcriptional regulator